MSVDPGIHVLLVDDSRTARDFYSQIFKKHGYLTHTASSVADGLKKVLETHCDIAIIDYFMPVTNGDQLCRALRADPAMGHITPVILTASYSDEVIMASLEAGASDCLFKDEPVELLLARVSAMVRSIQVRKTIEYERYYLSGILACLNDGVYGVDDKNLITFMNPAGLRILGYKSEQELIGREPHEAFHYALDDGRPNPVETCYLHQAYMLGDELPNWESVFWTRDGRQIWVECNVVPFTSAGNHFGSVVAFRDITQLREHLENLHWQAYHDGLTRLPNRRFFMESLEKEFYRLKRSAETSGLLYIDLDSFKKVNDTAGHDAGDELLIEVGMLLSKRLRAVDVLARLGGDEFGVILQNVNRESAMSIAQMLCELLEKYIFTYEGGNYQISASIGVALIDKDSDSPEQVLSRADTASYFSKNQGGGRVQEYQDHDNAMGTG